MFEISAAGLEVATNAAETGANGPVGAGVLAGGAAQDGVVAGVEVGRLPLLLLKPAPEPGPPLPLRGLLRDELVLRESQQRSKSFRGRPHLLVGCRRGLAQLVFRLGAEADGVVPGVGGVREGRNYLMILVLDSLAAEKMHYFPANTKGN